MKDTRSNILGAATEAFAELGYTAASVREICGRVGASPNAINYHFGSKEELYREIIEGFASGQLGLTSRMLTNPPRSAEDFEVRLELFFVEVLHLYLENRDTVRILYREFEQLVPHGPDGVVSKLFKTNDAISAFVAQGIERGFVGNDVDPDIVAGLLFLWHGSQKLFDFPAPAHEAPPFVTYVAGGIELVGGVLVMIGLYTRQAAFLCSGLMAAAYWMAMRTSRRT